MLYLGPEAEDETEGEAKASAKPSLSVDIADKTFVSADGVSLPALKDLSFEVRAGEFACLLGPSGCGKTTTLRILLGLDRNFSGSFRLPEGGRIAAVFQEPTLLPWRSVEDNVRLALPKPLRGKDLTPLFDTLGLSAMRKLFPGELSLGLARRAALARAFATEPDILFLDEPFVSLDEPTAGRLRHLLLSVWSARPTTALMVTHNLREALMLSDRIIVLSERPAHVVGYFDVRLPRENRNPTVMGDLVRSFYEKFPGKA
ncbi:ABC transporter ATP-binding protein [Mesorhizobium sp. IMUNJ 23232]|uniref:ABC transporter ATP-binding protein n=1 Tax=Mesorhizobium sp. IMUNJ 23232 TaxID=3376064 RepID=UPI00378EA7F8